MKKISVIIPCYNTEKYIERCIDSLVNQTIGIENLELIFVNDASADQTLEKLYELEKQFPDSVLVVNCLENGLIGKARNIGMSYASAAHIGFVDSDDIIELDMYEKMYEKAVNYDSDLVVCYIRKHTLEEMSHIDMGGTGREDSYFLIEDKSERARLLEMDINMSACNKLYKRSMLTKNSIEFPTGCIYEDVYFTGIYKNYVQSVYILEQYLYHHISRMDSVSHNIKDWRKRLEYFDIQVALILELKNRSFYTEYAEWYDNQFILEYITLIQNVIRNFHIFPKDVLSIMNQTIIELFPNYKEIRTIKNISQYSSNKFLKYIVNGIEKQIDDQYIKKLISIYFDSK